MAKPLKPIRYLSRFRCAKDAQYRGFLQSQYRLWQVSEKKLGADGKLARDVACILAPREDVWRGERYKRDTATHKKGDKKFRNYKAFLTGEEYDKTCRLLREHAVISLNPVIPDDTTFSSGWAHIKVPDDVYSVCAAIDVDHLPKGEAEHFLHRYQAKVPVWNSYLIHHKADEDTLQIKWVFKEALDKDFVDQNYKLANCIWNKMFPDHPCDPNFKRHIFKNHHYFLDSWRSGVSDYEAGYTGHLNDVSEWVSFAESNAADFDEIREPELAPVEQKRKKKQKEKTERPTPTKGNSKTSRNAYIFENRLPRMAEFLKTRHRMPTPDEIRVIHEQLNEETATKTNNGRLHGPLSPTELNSLIDYAVRTITEEKLLSYTNSFSSATDAKVLLSFLKAFTHNLVSLSPTTTYLYDESFIKSKFHTKKLAYAKSNPISSSNNLISTFYANDSYFPSSSTTSSYCRNETKISRSTTWRLKSKYNDLYSAIPTLKSHIQKCKHEWQNGFNELVELVEVILKHAEEIKENTLKQAKFRPVSNDDGFCMEWFTPEQSDMYAQSISCTHYGGGGG